MHDSKARDVVAGCQVVPSSGFYEPGWELNDADDLLDALADAGLVVVSDATRLPLAGKALSFVREFLGSAGNGEGWTWRHVEAAIAAGLGEPLTDEQEKLARSVLGGLT